MRLPRTPIVPYPLRVTQENIRIKFGMPSLSLLLASNSPRRRQLLALSGRAFLTRPASIDETPLPGEDPGAYVLRLARGKAAAAAQQAPFAGWILGADTTVALEGRILGKPADAAEAREMLSLLRGREHTVFTAIALRHPADGSLHSQLCATSVPMRAYSQEELETYVASGDPLDKAGAYAIQHPGFHPVEQFSGCFASVMGLPLCHLERALRGLDDPSPADVPAACQAELAYPCPVYRAILDGADAG
jgi:septum formation protein